MEMLMQFSKGSKSYIIVPLCMTEVAYRVCEIMHLFSSSDGQLTKNVFIA